MRVDIRVSLCGMHDLRPTEKSSERIREHCFKYDHWAHLHAPRPLFTRYGQVLAVESKGVSLVGREINGRASRYEAAGGVVDIRCCADRRACVRRVEDS